MKHKHLAARVAVPTFLVAGGSFAAVAAPAGAAPQPPASGHAQVVAQGGGHHIRP